ncbi:MAG: protein kinase [Elusimicrobiota bacterium]
MMRAFLFITLIVFNCDFLFCKVNHFDNILDTSTISYFLDSHYKDDKKITDPEKIIKSYRIIRKEPDRAAEAFISIMQSRLPEDQKRFIEENYDKVSYLLFNLDDKRSDKFDEVLKIVVENSFPVNPSLFNNFEFQAKEIIQSYVVDFNNRVARMPPNLRVPEISTSTLRYDNALTHLIEFARDIRRNPKTANNIAENISIAYSTNSSVQNGLARLFLDNSNYEEAKKYTDKAIEIDDKNYDAYTMRAEARYSLKDIKGAIEDVRKATEIDPTNETTKLLASFMSKSSGFSKTNLSSIKDSFASSDIDDSSFKETNPVIGGSADKVVENNRTDITIDEKKSAYYLKSAMVKAQMEDYKEAIKYLNMAIEKNPNNLDAYIERANTYNLVGDYDEAIKDATYVLINDPQNIHALNIRAWSLYKKGDMESAYNDTSKAIDLKPNYADAMFLRALIYEKQNKFDEMLSDLEKASRLNPNYISKFHDAVANYSYKAPNFMKYYDRNKDMFKLKKGEDEKTFNAKKFFFLLIFTILGGIFIGIALLHVFSPKVTTHTATTQSNTTQTDTLTPNIFYEGVATGKYKIVRKIGQGGMGSVYLAIDQTLNREVAIKKMNEDIKMNEREKQRFIEEARTVAMLHHPNIIEIYTIFEEKGDIYLVFEYIDGLSLDKKLDKEIRMPFYEVKEIINEISKALNYAHLKNIVHRDLKLSNVMVSKDGYIKVMDFGLAKVLREAKARYSSTEVVGSPAYMAPEQDLGIFIKESDLYSLGVCVYEMIVGELPFTGPDYHYQKEKKLFTPVSQVVVGLPEGIDYVISKLLEPKPENRYHSVEEFLIDFNKLQS